jgi:hypothetical protein
MNGWSPSVVDDRPSQQAAPFMIKTNPGPDRMCATKYLCQEMSVSAVCSACDHCLRKRPCVGWSCTFEIIHANTRPNMTTRRSYFAGGATSLTESLTANKKTITEWQVKRVRSPVRICRPSSYPSCGHGSNFSAHIVGCTSRGTAATPCACSPKTPRTAALSGELTLQNWKDGGGEASRLNRTRSLRPAA